MRVISVIGALALCAVLLLSACGKEKDYAPDPRYAGGYLGEEIIPVDARDTDEYGVKVDLSEAESELIAHLVSLEVGDKSYTAQVCFCEMILNRIADGGFPAGALGVVFDSGDFASVLAGKVTGTIPQGYRVTRRFRTAMKALKEAQSGTSLTGGALHFTKSGERGADDPDAFECEGVVFYR